MRIGFACDLPAEWLDNQPPRGPVPTPTLSLLAALRRESAQELVLVSLDRRVSKLTMRDSWAGIAVRVPCSRVGGIASLFWPRAVEVARAARAGGCDILHGQGLEREYGLAASMYGMHGVATVHGIISKVLDVPGVQVHWHQTLLRATERMALRRLRHLVAITPYVRTTLSPRTRAAWYDIPNAVSPVYAELKREPVPGRVLLVGSLYSLKGTLDAIEVIARVRAEGYPDAELRVVGGVVNDQGRYREECIRRVDCLGVRDSVVFRGWLAPDQVAEELRTASVLVLPSRQESAPMCIAESLCAGVPVAAYDVGGVRDMLSEPGAGLVVPPRDVLGLTRAVACLLERTTPQVAREAACRFYSPDRVAQLTTDMYSRIISDGRQRREQQGRCLD